VLPQRAHLAQQRQRLLHAVFQQLGAGISPASSPCPAAAPPAEEGLQRVDQLELVAQAQLDVDALDALGVLAHARQRDHHVLVDLEGVGVLGDGRRALAVEPELLARVGADGDEALAAALLAMRTTSLVARATAPRRRRRCRRSAPSWAGRCRRPAPRLLLVA
jgi:hypothetical protein